MLKIDLVEDAHVYALKAEDKLKRRHQVSFRGKRNQITQQRINRVQKENLNLLNRGREWVRFHLKVTIFVVVRENIELMNGSKRMVIKELLL